ncbi:hypothetical protein EDB19DRAFT_1713197 [Suillus lakei]|nr:hypothetical protein EDB19DRAFT_1713197 [Suillus lakei]
MRTSALIVRATTIRFLLGSVEGIISIGNGCVEGIIPMDEGPDQREPIISLSTKIRLKAESAARLLYEFQFRYPYSS